MSQTSARPQCFSTYFSQKLGFLCFISIHAIVKKETTELKNEPINSQIQKALALITHTSLTLE